MHRFLRLLIWALMALPAAAQTQVDPSFLPQRLYEPARANAALELGSGVRLVFGAMRAEHQNGPGLAAYQANGQLDMQFQANLATADWTNIKGAAEAPGGKIWLVADRVTYGATTYFQLVRLNADSSRDASFTPPTAGWGTIWNIAPQPDGKIIVGGTGLLRPGTTATVPALRLNADGSPDTAFNSRLASIGSLGFSSADATVLQPDGKLLLAVSNGYMRLFRLNTDGSEDTSFQLRLATNSPLATAQFSSAGALALQPDGKVLIGAGSSSMGLFPGIGSGGFSSHFFRFSSTGIYDPTFAPSSLLCPQRSNFMLPTVQVRPNGRIVVAVASPGDPFAPATHQYVAQLMPNGSTDTSWQFPTPIYSAFSALDDDATSVQLLASGQVLIAGSLINIDAPLALPTGVHLLQPTGAGASFTAPLLQQRSYAETLALQPGGQILVGGHFTEINGVPACNLARLQANGTTDLGFMARYPFAAAAATARIYPLLTYPDGRVLIGGNFTFQSHGQRWVNLVRLLANGRLDSSFVSTAYGAGSPYGSGLPPYFGTVYGAWLQPSGKIVIFGSPSGNASYQGQRYLARLTATGQLDATFQPAVASPSSVLVRSTGQLVVSTSGTPSQPATVTGLLPDGGLDPAFAAVSVTNGTAMPAIYQLQEGPGGKVLLRGDFSSVGTVATARLGQLQANGSPDPGFVAAPITQLHPAIPAIWGTGMQPNGRILLGGYMRTAGQTTVRQLIRLLPTGALDTGFGTALQLDNTAFGPVLQPDGAILVPGFFSTINGQQHIGLVRLLDSNVLRVAATQAEVSTAVYPIPAHAHLQLRLDATAKPKTVMLLDVTGHQILTQVVMQPEMELSTTSLAPGVYLLCVDYATGAVTRRVVIE
jgi:uncharacterized delta-60 repeat protein